MELNISIKMNPKLYFRNPEESVLGKKIVKNGVILINRLGFEEFTFKKLAIEIQTTEASIYRYFENKHRLLVYIITWYWSYIEYRVIFSLNNIENPQVRLKSIIKILVNDPAETETDFISAYQAHKLVLWEGSKAYLTRNVSQNNKDRLFKPYKDLCERISADIRLLNPRYKYPHSLASTLLEMSHAQKFFRANLPSLTDFSKTGNEGLIAFLEMLVFKNLGK